MRSEEPTAQADRVALARREVGHTDVRPATAFALTLLFLASISGATLTQLVSMLRAPSGTGSELVPTNEPSPAEDGGSLFAANRRLLASIDRLSDRLEHDHPLAEAIRPAAQRLLIELGAGTEQVWQGRDGWLFFRPDIDHVTGPGFLSPRQLARRAAIGDTLREPPQPDPRPAMLTLAADLLSRDIALIVVPTPVKPSVHPEHLARDLASTRSVFNPSRERLLRELREAGVLVFDPWPAIRELKRTGAVYLATDTHWRPETMEAVARALAVFVREHVDLPDAANPDYQLRENAISNTGDIAVLLDLDARQTPYPPETVTVRSVTTPSGGLWRADRSADVLVLGDSFSNVFSLGAMGWGEAGGLVEHLSYALERPVDRLTRNDDGAFAPREMLADELRRGQDRLSGKRVVVYQFAERELSQGNWKRIDLAGVPVTNVTNVTNVPKATFLAPASAEPIVVRGRLAELAPPPEPQRVPYRDHIIAVRLTDIVIEEGAATGAEALLYMWSMRDKVLTPAARYRPGQTMRFRLTPWAEISEELERIQRAELEDDTIRLAEPWWAEPLDER